MARILYLGAGQPGTTSLYRAQALRRLGHDVEIADPYVAAGGLLANRWTAALHYRSGYRALQPRMTAWVRRRLAASRRPDLAWVDSGELLGPDCIGLLSRAGVRTLLYNQDDPTGGRDGHRFDMLLAALPAYDLCAVFRAPNEREYAARGARRILRVPMSYDEVMHAPLPDASDITLDMRSEVAFIGTWQRGERRDCFLAGLVARGIPVAIWGAHWELSPQWEALRPHHRGGNLSGRDYVAAMQGARVCIGMLSQGNRDLHTTRTMEIPYAGGLLCAQRTSEHVAMFRDGVEAVFWDSVDECAHHCRALLADVLRREAVRRAGMARIRAIGAGNESVCGRLVSAALAVQPAHGCTAPVQCLDEEPASS